MKVRPNLECHCGRKGNKTLPIHTCTYFTQLNGSLIKKKKSLVAPLRLYYPTVQIFLFKKKEKEVHFDHIKKWNRYRNQTRWVFKINLLFFLKLGLILHLGGLTGFSVR